MESQAFKLLLSFIVIMAIGFIIVGTTRETQQEKVQGAFLQTANVLGSLALGKCSSAVEEQVGEPPYTPTETSSDHMSYVNLIWKGKIGTASEAECRYVMDQGIVLLRINDRTLIQKDGPNTAGSTGKATSVHH
ncbi:MAG: hypothetical protein ACR2HF_16320 [Methylococcaceae bacterium]